MNARLNNPKQLELVFHPPVDPFRRLLVCIMLTEAVELLKGDGTYDQAEFDKMALWHVLGAREELQAALPDAGEPRWRGE